MAYVLLLEEIGRHSAMQTQAALIAQAMGHDVELPDPIAIRARFDELLRAEPVDSGPRASREAVLQEAFGLSGG